MPIERDGFYSMLGIAMRAGALTLGESGVRQAVQSGKACCVLVDEAASENTKKRLSDSCAYYGVPLFETQADRLGYAIGKPGRMSAAIAKGTLGDKLTALAKEV